MDFDWLQVRDRGLYCAPGDFYIDPLRPVDRAVITHGHADHARPGHVAVLATPATADIMAVRYGAKHAGAVQKLDYGCSLRVGDARVWFRSAGHILGSAQACIEYRGQRIVISGDYKRRSDPTCPAFEVTPADLFVTEATFGLPVFRHPDTASEVAKLTRSLEVFPDRTHLIGVYALGKCQRVICELRALGYDKPIYVHGALRELSDLYEAHGVKLGPLIPVTAHNKKETEGNIVLCPPGALADRWSRGFPSRITGLASGWMMIRQRVRQRRVELPLVISDHADWDELTQTIRDVGAPHVRVTHGQEDALVHYARGLGLDAEPLSIHGWATDGQGEEAA